MRRTMRIPMVVATTVLVLPLMTSTGQAASTAARCRTRDLSVHLGHGDAAAGSTFRPVVFTNESTATCSLAGFPGVAYVAPRTGDQVGAAAARNTQHPARTIQLTPGERAVAMLQLVDARNYPAKRCAATTVSGLRVYPPNATRAAYVPFASNRRACSSSVTQLTVQAVRPGR